MTMTKDKPAEAPKPVTPRARKMAQKTSLAAEPTYVQGRRTFFKYRDLGVTQASDGLMRAQVIKAITGMTSPTGWHYHVCQGQFVYVTKGWLDLEFADGTKCHMGPGDSCYIPGGMPHNETATSDDVELIEMSVPAEMGTVALDGPTAKA